MRSPPASRGCERAGAPRASRGSASRDGLLPVLEAQDAALVLGEGVECLGQEARHGLAADAARLDEPGDPEPAEMPRDERLAEPDALDELGDGRLTLGEALDDPQPVHVGEGLVDEADRAQLVGLVDDGRDGRADVRWGWGQEAALRVRRRRRIRARPTTLLRAEGSTTIYINMR